MSSEQHSGASSPLSSAPSNIATPSSKRHRDESDEKDSPAQGPDQDFNSELGDEWGEDVFNDNLPKNADATSGNDPPKNYSAPAPLLPAAPSPVNDDGFSKSELERAIAASLGVTEQSDPEKRKAVALEAAVAFREWDKSSGSPPMKFNPSYRYLRPILAKPAALKKQAAAAAAKPAAKKRRIEMLTTSMRSPLIQRDLRKILNTDRAWRALTYEQQKDLAGMLEFAPDIGGTGNLTSRNVLKEALSSNDPLRTDVREYSEGMSYGWEDPMWIEEAHESMEMRVRGDLGTGIWDDDEEEEEDEVEEEEEEEKDESFELDYDEEQDVVKQEVSKEKGKRKAADDVEPVTGDTKEAWWKDPDLQ